MKARQIRCQADRRPSEACAELAETARKTGASRCRKNGACFEKAALNQEGCEGNTLKNNFLTL